MATNDFLPFCSTDTGLNLESQATYLADPNRLIGNQPGIASSQFVNKAARQASFIISSFAQFISNMKGVDLLDDGNSAALLSKFTSTLLFKKPAVTVYSSGSGTHNKTYIFAIVSGSATIGATYTNNGFTYTATETVASGLSIRATGPGVPLASGTLTKTGGTGDATLTFNCYTVCLYMRIRGVAGGGAGAGSSNTTAHDGGAGGTGGNTTFGANLAANGGVGGVQGTTNGNPGGIGGTATLGTGPQGINVQGGGGAAGGGSISSSATLPGAMGGSSFFGGAGVGVAAGTAGGAGRTNTGGGGGGGGSLAGGVAYYQGPGGGAGGYFDAVIENGMTGDAATFAYSVGAAGTAGTAGTAGFAGGAGGSGVLIVEEFFQ